ncbi:MAG: hypothetical protein ACRDWD_04260 [Acidimicrobiia bacterium]
MFLWYVGISILIVWYVFQSAGLDYRFVAFGSLLPLLVDIPFDHQAYGHTLIASVALLAAVMILTVGRPRLTRRRWLCLPIGSFCALALSGAFTNADVFWWPFKTDAFGDVPLLPVWWVVVLEEIAGLVACWWIVGRFGLYELQPRREFIRTGRLT